MLSQLMLRISHKINISLFPFILQKVDTKILRHTKKVLQVVRRGAGSCLTPKSMILTTKQQCLLKCRYMMLEEARVEGIQVIQ